MNLFEHIKSLLSQNEKYCKDGKLFKNVIVEDALKVEQELLSILLSDDKAIQHFFTEVGKVLVFDKIKFQKFVSNKQFLPDSYTSFKNKIGLTANGEYLTESKEVVLDFPYKDCVLEGGQTKDDQKRKEIFWNGTLAPDEIDRLFEPKALTNFKRYDKKGCNRVDSISLDDNLIIKGNNLLALHSLKKVYKGKIKLIYIDPPYNTGGDGFNYNDSFNHSSWLTFMKNRLEVAKELLRSDGSIWINIDDREGHYLKVLCDEVMGRDNFIINFIWQKKYSPSNDAKFFSDNHDHILVFAKDKTKFKANLLPRTDEMNKRYKNPDNDPRGDWKPGGFSVKTYSKEYDYPIETPTGKIVYPPDGSCWQTSKDNYLKKLKDNRIWFGTKGDAKPQLKQFLSEVQQGVVAKSIWLYNEVGHNQISRSEILKYFGEFKFSTPKPEGLLKRIIELGTNEGDMILDFFAGSGTTMAVAHKIKRKYIGIEQMDYIETVTVERMKKVIDGLEVGISNEVNWNGGGDFVYFELLNLNNSFFQIISKAKTKEDLLDIFNVITESPFLSYHLKNQNIADFMLNIKNNEIDTIKKVLFDILDSNMLYLPYSEIEDKDYNISSLDKKLTKLFYNK